MLVEPKGILNTGNVKGDLTALMIMDLNNDFSLYKIHLDDCF